MSVPPNSRLRFFTSTTGRAVFVSTPQTVAASRETAFIYDGGASGCRLDRETNLHQNFYRDCYDPVTGRYCQSDPIGLDGGINPYSYVLSNPLSYIDLLGLANANPANQLGGTFFGGGGGGGRAGGGGGGGSFGGRAVQSPTHDVYLGLSEGQPAYVGITNNISRRATEWSGKYELQGINTCPVTKDQARAIEQVLIEKYPVFNNRINSISPSRSWYQEATDWGRQWLIDHGFL